MKWNLLVFFKDEIDFFSAYIQGCVQTYRNKIIFFLGKTAKRRLGVAGLSINPVTSCFKNDKNQSLITKDKL